MSRVAPARALLLPALLVSTPLWALPQLSLVEIEAKASTSSQYRQINAEHELVKTELAKQKQEAGWRWIAGASTGKIREIEGDGSSVESYYGQEYNLGLSYPLLGSYQAEQEQTLRIKAIEARTEGRLVRQSLLDKQSLSELFINYWAAYEQAELAKALLLDQQKTEVLLKHRSKKGLLFKSDAKILINGLSDVKNNLDYFIRRQQRLLEQIEYRLQQPVPFFKPIPDRIASRIINSEQWLKELLRQAPEIKAANEVLDYTRGLQRQYWWQSVESEFTIRQQLVKESRASENGRALLAGVSFSIPLNINNWVKTNNEQGIVEMKLDLARRDQLRELQKERFISLLDEFFLAGKSTQLFQNRLESSRYALHEKSLRANKLAGDVLEQLIKARLDYYSQGFALINSAANLWLAQIKLKSLGISASPYLADYRLILPEKDYLVTLLRQHRLPVKSSARDRQPKPVNSSNQGVYIWDSSRLLHLKTQQYELDLLNKEGIQTLLLGFTSSQINEFTVNPVILERALNKIKESGFRVFLLLGDPYWIEPEYRGQLLTIIQKLSRFTFDGLNLDLEIAQLKNWETRSELLALWGDTIRLAQKMSPWPVSVTLHPRWFDKERGCLSCILVSANISDVTVMIYQNSSSAILKQVSKLSRQGIDLNLAVSVESDKGFSIASQSDKKFYDIKASLLKGLSKHNINQVWWQDWQHFRKICCQVKQEQAQ